MTKISPHFTLAELSMKDRLMEDGERRRQGAFFTPAQWVAEAHAELDRVLGPNWRETCIVWDPAAGTGNLTRDYHFKELISSTCERPDVAAMQLHGWGGRVFQYDFLNPDVDSPFFALEDGANVIPDDVDAALEAAAKVGKRLVILMNPPYGTAGSGSQHGASKAGVAKTVVNLEMKGAGMGRPSSELYAQFMFRCANLAEEYGFKESTVALFCKPTFMTSGSYKPFRDWWYKSHEYQGGFMFQASHFADVSGAWGVSFTVWNSPGQTESKTDIPIRLCDVRDFDVITDGVKNIYNSDGREASKWVREPIKEVKDCIEIPQFTSGVRLRVGNKASGLRGHLWYLRSTSNSLMCSDDACMVSGLYADANGFSILPSNWRRSVNIFGARKLIQANWINDKDEYLAPDETLPGYEQWVDDCHVYGLLHTSNNCAAMRDVQYKGKSWRIQNNWFWKTKAESLAALDTVATHQTYRDCKTETEEDPYLAQVLPGLNLSPEAQRVLDLLNALWLKSLPMRENYYATRPIEDKKPDLHLNAWDAGVYQLKHLWRDLFPDEWKELQAARKALEVKLQPGVFTYGFLKE